MDIQKRLTRLNSVYAGRSAPNQGGRIQRQLNAAAQKMVQQGLTVEQFDAYVISIPLDDSDFVSAIRALIVEYSA